MKIIAVTNTLDSPLAQQADACLPLHAKFDHLVSITMYSGLTLVGSLAASMALGALPGRRLGELTASLEAAQTALAGWQEELETSDWFDPEAPTYLLARGGISRICHEARLLGGGGQGASFSPTHREFPHGPQEVVHAGLRVGLWVDGVKMRAQDLSLAQDLRRHGAKVLLIGQKLKPDAADVVMNIPAIPAEWRFLVDIIPMTSRLSGLRASRGEDCDSFRICPYIIEVEGGLTAQADR